MGAVGDEAQAHINAIYGNKGGKGQKGGSKGRGKGDGKGAGWGAVVVQEGLVGEKERATIDGDGATLVCGFVVRDGRAEDVEEAS